MLKTTSKNHAWTFQTLSCVQVLTNVVTALGGTLHGSVVMSGRLPLFIVHGPYEPAFLSSFYISCIQALKLLVKAATREYDAELVFVTDFYNNDFNQEQLCMQLLGI